MMDFKYTTIKELRDEGLTLEQADDKRVRSLIKFSSSFINKATEQWFNPLVEKPLVSGRGESIIHLPSFIPIIKVNNLTYIWNSERALVSKDNYKVHERYIRAYETIDELCDGVRRDSSLFYHTQAEFERGPLNFEIDGVFGWLENKKEVSGLTVSEITLTSEEVTMDSEVDAFDVGDYLIITKGELSYNTIISEIDYGNKKLKFDKAEDLKKPIAIGAEVKTYGRVPLLITRVCNQLVIVSSPKMASSEFQTLDLQSRIKSEKTDNYSYSLFEADDGETGASITGNSKIDEILESFKAPVFPVFP